MKKTTKKSFVAVIGLLVVIAAATLIAVYDRQNDLDGYMKNSNGEKVYKPVDMNRVAQP